MHWRIRNCDTEFLRVDVHQCEYPCEKGDKVHVSKTHVDYCSGVMSRDLKLE
jgi:hypothetical protein